MKKRDLLICECNSTEHQMIFNYDPDENNPICYAHIHLKKRSFFQRLKYGLKYIFGYQCRYGAFDEFLFNPDDAQKIQNLVDYLNKEKENDEHN